MTGIHSGNMGDIIYSIPLMRSLGVNKLLLNTNGVHNTTLKESHCNAIIPLLESQGFECSIVTNKECSYDYDLDLFRVSCEDLVATHLSIAQAKAHKVNINTSEKFIKNIEVKTVADIVIHRSYRYHNPVFEWEFIREFLDDTVFIGYPQEHTDFVKATKLPVKHFLTKDLLETAKIISGSKLFIGNQSTPFAIAEGLKHFRILEVDTRIPNCQPQTWNGLAYMFKQDKQRAYGFMKYLIG